MNFPPFVRVSRFEKDDGRVPANNHKWIDALARLVGQSVLGGRAVGGQGAVGLAQVLCLGNPGLCDACGRGRGHWVLGGSFCH